MGCDIHCFAEVLKGHSVITTGKGRFRWVMAKNCFTDNYDKTKKTDSPFDWRSYGLFGFLGNVRNYSSVPFLSDNRGFPDAMSDEVSDKYWEYGGQHSLSWLLLSELLDFDYDKTFENLRYEESSVGENGCKVVNGAAIALNGCGKLTTYREFLGENFFVNLKELSELGSPDKVRIVFWFDD